jgi:hypothetical protein
MDIKFAPAGTTPEAPERTSRNAAKRRVQLERAEAQFENDRRYTEPQVNELLKPLFIDHVFARRALIERGYLDRTPSGSEYWVREQD